MAGSGRGSTALPAVSSSGSPPSRSEPEAGALRVVADRGSGTASSSTPPESSVPPPHSGDRVAAAAEDVPALPDFLELADPPPSPAAPSAGLLGFLDLPHVADPFPLPPVPSAPAPHPSGDVPDALLFAGIASYWATHQVITPILHRHAFEHAFLDRSPLYGPRPIALLFAMAAHGIRNAPLVLPEAERLRCAGACFARAKALLLAGFLGSPVRPVSPLEAAQAGLLLFQFALPNIMAADLDPLAPFFATMVASLEGEIGAAPAAGEDGWARLRREFVGRLKIELISQDCTIAGIKNRPLFRSDYFSGPVAMPAAEWHVEARPGGGLDVTLGEMASRVPISVDLSPLLAPVPNLGRIAAALAGIMPAVLAGHCSRMALTYCNSALAVMQARLRDLAASAAIDPVRLATRAPGPGDTPEEVLYRLWASAIDTAVDTLADTVPDPIGPALRAGNPNPLFAYAPLAFPDAGHAHSFLSNYMSRCAAGIRAWLAAPEAGPTDPAFFTSRPFVSAVEWAIVATDLMRGQLAADPHLVHVAPTAAVPATAIGGLQLATAASLASAGNFAAAGRMLDDAEAVLAWGSALAAQMRPLGSAIAGAFAERVGRARAMAERGQRAVLEAAFAREVMAGEEVTRTMLSVRELVA
ncbi:hypothetical protein DFJ74DRAFT_672752 [Hyaloraphidium curvatum]|nr:hypothetical protein DFJ74DRAFT_672752 [Hyaloraphidium curvatum]